MQNFDYMTPTRLIFGKESIVKLPNVMAQFGKRILLTYGGGSIKKIGLYDRVKELLEGYDIVELSGIQPNPKYDPSVLEGADDVYEIWDTVEFDLHETAVPTPIYRRL